MVADDDLTGAWKGIFHYPNGLAPGLFDAELREFQGGLTGETFEIEEPGQPLHALLQGYRQGGQVGFVKQYDDLQRAVHPVHYAGRVADGGLEITGTWTIAGHWSGTFLMIRAKPVAAVAERKEVARVG